MFVFNFIGTAFYVHENNLTKIQNKQGCIHQCQYCHYKTYYSTHLKKHVLTHTGERPFACAFCNYRCSQKTNLKKHVMLKHTSDGI